MQILLNLVLLFIGFIFLIKVQISQLTVQLPLQRDLVYQK